MATISESGQRSLWDRQSSGRTRKYENSADLWNKCCDYFKWCEANPIIEIKPHAYLGEITYSKTERIRPFTKWGLWTFLGIRQMTWEKYRDYEGDDEEHQAMAEVCKDAETIMLEQKFACAATDQMNAGFIAKELGLSDRQQVDHISTDGSMGPSRIELIPVTDAKDGKD